MSATESSPPAKITDAGIRFILDGAVVEVDATHIAPTTSLLTYLRDHLGRSGTKEGCAEGDCGACTVVVGELCGNHPGAGAEHPIDWRPVNSCIRFLPTLHGKEIVTVESLAGADGALHPVQQAMVDCHGSQCGFCTPGFVMSLFGLYLDDPAPPRGVVVDALAGNLCRCTGYRPIIEAGVRMGSLPEPARWNRADAQSAQRVAALEAIAPGAPLQIDAIPGAHQGYHAPRTLDQLARRYADQPGALLLAGGTDIGLWVTKHLRDLPPLLYIGDVAELHAVSEHDGKLDIGAAVPLTEAYAAIVRHWPMLAELANRFASPPVRNSGTLCGNIANGSPIGDSMPILIALGAEVVLRRDTETRVMALEDLYLGYQKKALLPGEFVAAARIPLPPAGTPQRIACYKISKRFDQDISAVCAAFCIEVDHGTVRNARIAYGGMAATPKRAPLAEAALNGQPWSQASIDAAVAALARDYQPLSDMRASDAYRREVAGNALRRFYLEHADGAAAAMPLRINDLVAS